MNRTTNQKCESPLGTRGGKKTDSLSNASSTSSTADTLILAQWDSFWNSDLQNCKMTNLCCVKLVSLWQFFTTAIKNEGIRLIEIYYPEHGPCWVIHVKRMLIWLLLDRVLCKYHLDQVTEWWHSGLNTLTDFLSTCSISHWKKGAEISKYNWKLSTSVRSISFPFMCFKAVTSCMYIQDYWVFLMNVIHHM